MPSHLGWSPYRTELGLTDVSQLHEHGTRWAGDLAAAGAILGTVINWLPPLAALLGIIWYAIMIWESHTVTAWRFHQRARKHRGRGKTPPQE